MLERQSSRTLKLLKIRVEVPRAMVRSPKEIPNSSLREAYVVYFSYSSKFAWLKLLMAHILPSILFDVSNISKDFGCELSPEKNHEVHDQLQLSYILRLSEYLNNSSSFYEVHE